MEDLILLDSSVLIEYFRAKVREESFFFKLSAHSSNFCISVITHFEISAGINIRQELFWSNFFSDIILIPYNVSLNFTAVNIYKQLKTKGISIEFKDLIIAATAIQFDYNLATLNKRHFENIPGVKLFIPDSF